MMQWVTPFIFPLMLYNGPSGLNIYIFSSTLFGVIESKVIRKHIKEREEAEKAGRVVIDARPTRLGRKSGSGAIVQRRLRPGSSQGSGNGGPKWNGRSRTPSGTTATRESDKRAKDHFVRGSAFVRDQPGKSAASWTRSSPSAVRPGRRRG